MKQKKIAILVIGLIVVVGIVLAGIFLTQGEGARKIREQLDLGQKYLAEMNYEEAIVAFTRTIELDSMNVDAYIGLADAYMGLGDADAARQALQDGYDVTGDESLLRRMDELEEEIRVQLEETQKEIMARREEWFETCMDIPYMKGVGRIYLTYAERKAAYQPYVAVLQEMIDIDPEYDQAYISLGNLYLMMNELELCLEIRQKGYENTGNEVLITQERKAECEGGYLVYDAYGQWIESPLHREQYNEQHQMIYYEDIGEQEISGTWYEVEYDSEGRTSMETGMRYYQGELQQSYINRYVYNGDGTVTENSEGIIYSSGSQEPYTNSAIIAFDMYGNGI